MDQPSTNLANQENWRDPGACEQDSKPAKLAQPHPGHERCPAEPGMLDQEGLSPAQKMSLDVSGKLLLVFKF
jgi:hypothetical protein